MMISKGNEVRTCACCSAPRLQQAGPGLMAQPWQRRVCSPTACEACVIPRCTLQLFQIQPCHLPHHTMPCIGPSPAPGQVWLVKLEGVESPEEAALLRGHSLLIPASARQALEDEDEFYVQVGACCCRGATATYCHVAGVGSQ